MIGLTHILIVFCRLKYETQKLKRQLGFSFCAVGLLACGLRARKYNVYIVGGEAGQRPVLSMLGLFILDRTANDSLN